MSTNVYCPKCGQPVPSNFKFCDKCGAIISVTLQPSFCPQCGRQCEPGERFCEDCGAELTPNTTSEPGATGFETFGGFGADGIGNIQWDISSEQLEAQQESYDAQRMENFEYTRNPDGTYIVTRFKGMYDDSVTVSDCVKVIAEGAFEGARLIEVTLPEKLTFIGAGAFRNCRYLEKINIPSSVRVIEDEAFAGCEKLDIAIPATVKNQGKNILLGTKTDRLAKEKAERKAREEAERKAREEATRKAREEAERKVREEAERKVREEAERKAREEAARKAQEEAARKAREEAERKAREETERKAREEAARKAQEEAARKAQEEAERRAREEAERRAQAEAERRARAEAERKAREEAERKAKEVAARRAQQEAERKAREEATRKAREEAARKAKEEAEKRAREEAERQAREEAALRVAEKKGKTIRVWLIISYILVVWLCIQISALITASITSNYIGFFPTILVASIPSFLQLIYAIVAGVIVRNNGDRYHMKSFNGWYMGLTALSLCISLIYDMFCVQNTFILAILIGIGLKIVPAVIDIIAWVIYMNISHDAS